MATLPLPTPIVIGQPLEPPDPTCNLNGYIYLPDESKFPKPWPGIVGVHAGGFYEGGPQPLELPFGDTVIGLVAHGFLCMIFDVRLMLGGSQQNRGLPGQTTDGRYHQQTDDFKIGVRYMRAHPDCVGFVGGLGGSASAHHVAFKCAVGTIGDDRLDAGIALSAPMDFSDRQTDVSQHFINIVTDYGRTTNLTTLLSESPVAMFDNTISPLIFCNGLMEAMPFSQSVLAKAKLDALGVTNYVQRINGNNLHAFATWPDANFDCTAFMVLAYNAWLSIHGGGGKPPPPPPPTPTKEVITVQLSGMDPSTPMEFTAAAKDKVTGLVGPVTPFDFVTDRSAGLTLKDEPQGVFVLIPSPGGIPGDLTNRAWWQFDYVDGSRFPTQWNVLQPGHGQPPNFTAIDAYLAQCVTDGKDASISISAGIFTPQWVFQKGAIGFAETGPNAGIIPLPWDPIFIQAWSQFIRAFATAYDGHPNLKSVVMGGMGQVIDTFIVRQEDYAAFNLVAQAAGYADANAGFQDGAQQIITYWLKSMRTTRCFLSLALPVPLASGGFDSISELVAFGVTSGRGQFGVMTAGLTGATTADGTGTSVDDIIFNAARTPTAYEFLAPSVNVACDPTQNPLSYLAELGLRDAANAGITLGGQPGVAMIEFYESDILTVAPPPPNGNLYPADFSAFETGLAANLAPPPPLPGSFLKPNGCMCLFAADTTINGTEPCWTNPAITGVRLRATWAAIETADGTYNWTNYDAAVTAAAAHGKQLGLSVVGGNSYPAWVAALGAQVVTLSTGACLLPWDPIALSKWLALVTAFGARYNGHATYVPMGGFSRELTTEFILSPADIPLIDSLGGLAAWTTCYNTVAAKYAQVFPGSTIIVVAAGAPYPNAAGGTALQTVVTGSLGLYPNLGPMQTSLDSNTSGGSQTWKFIKDYAATHPNVTQFVTSVHGFGGLMLHGTVAQVLTRGIQLKSHAIEVYEEDADNVVYAPDLEAANVGMPTY